MGRKKGTSRHSISVKGLTYQRIKDHVGEDGSISNFCEEVIADKLGPPSDRDRKKFDESEQERIEKLEAENADEMDGYVPPIQFF